MFALCLVVKFSGTVKILVYKRGQTQSPQLAKVPRLVGGKARALYQVLPSLLLVVTRQRSRNERGMLITGAPGASVPAVQAKVAGQIHLLPFLPAL
jgi:hypothetical protein